MLKKAAAFSCAVFTAAMVIILFTVSPAAKMISPPDISSSPPPVQTPSGTPEPENYISDSDITITLLRDGELLDIPLFDYLLGVLYGEMPATFPFEAIKAQAAAARTYAVRYLVSGRSDDHPQADVCSDSSHCQAWHDPNEMPPAALAVFSEALEQTDGIIITYEEKPIQAAFFSTSWGTTEQSENVWGGSLPYLVSVSSPGEEEAPRYSESLELTPEAFKKAILAAYPAALFSDDPTRWITNIILNPTGSVASLSVGGVTLTGRQLRGLIGLNSTNFTVTAQADKFIFRTLGFGHGVGMSQYGARAMALGGSDFEQILTHYYTGVTLCRYSLE